MANIVLLLATVWSEFLMLWTGEAVFWVSAMGLVLIALLVWYLRSRHRS